MGNKKSIPVILHEFEIQRIMTMTNFKRDEIVYWHLSFLKDCPDGELTKKKFAEFYETFYPNGQKDKSLESVFKYFDADGNGTIDFNEFMIILKLAQQKNEMMEKITSVINDLEELDKLEDVDEKDSDGSLKAEKLSDSLSSDLDKQSNRQDHNDDNNGRHHHRFDWRRRFQWSRQVERDS